MILAPNEMQAEPDERLGTKICLEICLEADLYRIGHTKARSKNEKTPKSGSTFHTTQPSLSFQFFFRYITID